MIKKPIAKLAVGAGQDETTANLESKRAFSADNMR